MLGGSGCQHRGELPLADLLEQQPDRLSQDAREISIRDLLAQQRRSQLRGSRDREPAEVRAGARLACERTRVLEDRDTRENCRKILSSPWIDFLKKVTLGSTVFKASSMST